jgi:tRNA(Ile2) C34 agmatinyltransferase TiaS
MAIPPNGIPCKYCGKRLCSGSPGTWQPTLKCPHCGHVYREEAIKSNVVDNGKHLWYNI